MKEKICFKERLFGPQYKLLVGGGGWLIIAAVYRMAAIHWVAHRSGYTYLFLSVSFSSIVRGEGRGKKNTVIFRTLSKTMGGWGSTVQRPKLF